MQLITRETIDESALLKTTASLLADSGFRADYDLLVHFYVMLKSKPLLILSAPPGSGKTALIQGLVRVLLGGNLQQFQSMIGHAWWAGRAGNVALLTEAQTRLNTGKFMLLMDKAGRAENSDQLYIACMNNISPAEASGFFSEVAFQIQNERLMRLPGYHFTEPIPYPPNLILIGTTAEGWRNGLNDDFYTVGSVVRWKTDSVPCQDIASDLREAADLQAMFLKSRLRDPAAARARLTTILGDTAIVFSLLQQIAGLVEQGGFHLPYSLLDRGMIYLANAWSHNGEGLFAAERTSNLNAALDNLLARDVLQSAMGELVESESVNRRLQDLLNDKFPYTRQLLVNASL